MLLFRNANVNATHFSLDIACEEEDHIGYLAFVYLLSQFEAHKELTPQRVQAQLLTLHQGDGHHRVPNLTLPHHL